MKVIKKHYIFTFQLKWFDKCHLGIFLFIKTFILMMSFPIFQYVLNLLTYLLRFYDVLKASSSIKFTNLYMKT